LVADGIGVVVWLFVALLVGLGDEFAFYIASHYWISGDPAASREWNLAEAIRRPARGLVSSGLAMAFAFLALLVVSYPIMTQLGWITAFGLLAMMVAAFVVLPVGLAYSPPGNQHGVRAWRWVAGGHEWASRFPRAGLLIWIGALGVGGILAAGVRVELHPWKVALRNNPATQEMEHARHRLRFWPSPLLMVSQGDTPEEALAKDRGAVGAIDVVGGRGGVVLVESLSRLLPPVDTQRVSIAYVQAHAADFDPVRFRREYDRAGGDPGYAELVSRLLNPDPKPLTLEGLRRLGLDTLVDRHLIPSEGGYLAVSYLYLEQFPWAEGVIPRFESAMATPEYPALRQVQFVGDALRGSLHADRLKRESWRATGLAFLLVGLLLGFRFRRPRPVLLCLVPLVAGTVGALAVMRVMAIELNVLTLGVAPILVGLCVDDGIHIVEGLRQGQPAGAVLRHSGAAMIVTTLTTIAAAACLGLASFAGVREVGLVVAAGLVVALLASLHLLPLLWRLSTNRRDEA
jgi:predicted exporter